MVKRAYAIEMTYDISKEEKIQAEKALMCFNHAKKLIEAASSYLDIMKTPFKNNSEIPEKDILKARAAIRRFRDKAIKNFNNFKIAAFKCINLMHMFSSDTQTFKLIKSFISSVDDLEDVVNNFADLFSDLSNKEFVSKIIAAIESIQKQSKEVEEIIDDRIKNHIQTNILAKNWVDDVSDKLQLKIQKRTPLLLDLFNQRQDQIKP